MSTACTCPQCGAGLPADAPRGLCPTCLIRTGEALVSAATAPAPIMPEAQGLSLPCPFANYELMEEVARGGMGVVYKARQKGLGRLVAVKMILAGRFASHEFLRRFQAEAAIIARLRHPHIVTVHEVGEFDGQPFFSMDFIDGRNLAQVIAETGFTQIGFDRAARWMRTIGLAVEHAHEHGVFHRDLKPANILIDAEDEPRVTDFGLAKRVENVLSRGEPGPDPSGVDSLNSLTLSGQLLGSPSYTPPEQAAGRHDEIGPASDVYALGAILYHVLAGRPPFAAASVASTITQVLQAEPVTPRLLNPSVPRDLETICLKCLEKEPRRRYATAQEFADELGRFLRNEPILARPTSWLGRVWRWSHRQPALAGVTAAFVLSVIAGFAGILWQLQRANHFAREQTVHRHRAEAAANRLELERAEELFAEDDSPAALSYLARVLRREPAHPVATARLLSALSHRNFALPLGEPIKTTNRVNWVRFSPEEARVVLACFDGTAQVWDLQSGRPITPPMRHKERVRYAEFSPDGTRVVTASADHTARVWDAATGEPLTPLLEHDEFVNIARFSPDGQWIVSGSDDGTARIWNARSGEPGLSRILQAGAESSILAVEFSADGGKLLVGSRASGVRIWDARKGESDERTFKSAEEMRSSAFSPDGRWVAVGGHEGTVSIWTTATARLMGELPKQNGPVQWVEFSPQGLRLLTAAGNTVRLWDALTLQPVCEPIRHPSLVTSAQFSRDGRRLVISSYDTPVRLWDVTPGQILTTLASGQGPYHDLAFNADGSKLAVAGYAWAQGWDVKRWKWSGPRHALPFSSRHVQFYPDGRSVLVLMSDGACDGFDLETGAAKFPRFSEGALETGLASPDGEHVALEGYDDGALPLSAGRDTQNTVTIWNVRTRQPVTPPMAHRNEVYFCSFSSDGRWFATASHDTTARVWDARTGQPVTPPLPHDRHVNRARFSPDGRWLLTASDDNKARLWALHHQGALHQNLNHDAAVEDAEFSPDGTRVITTSGRVVRVWDPATGRALTEPMVHPRTVTLARFSPNGRTIATASDSRLRLWDTVSGLPVSEALQHRGAVRGVCFSPDGRWLASISRNETVSLRELPNLVGPAPDWLIELAEGFAGRYLAGAAEQKTASWQRMIGLRQAIMNTRAPNDFIEWGRWFFASRSARQLSPSSPLTAEEYLRRRGAEPFLHDLLEAMQLSQTNVVLLACLGAEARKWDEARGATQLEAADWLTWHAFRLHSNSLAVVRARAETLYGIGQSSAAMLVVEHWLALAPADGDAWELRGCIHSDAQRWAEAWADFSRAGVAETNRERMILRKDSFRRTFASELKSLVVEVGRPLTLSASPQPAPEISWQWQREAVDIPGATEPVLRFPSVAPTDFGRYSVRLRHPSGETAVSPTVLVGTRPVAGSVTGHWDFDDGTLGATVGFALEFFDGPGGETAKQTRFGSTAELGLPDIDGRPARVMRFPPASPTMGYILAHAAQANGGGRRVNRYTIIMDVLIPSLSDPTNGPRTSAWTSLYQSNLRNLDNAEFYLNWSKGRGRPGVVGEYGGSTLVITGQWHRIVVAVDLTGTVAVLSKYVDGRKHADQTFLREEASGNLPERDGRFSLPPAILLFTDDDGETTAGYVNSIQFHNVKLTDEQIAALGGPSADGIPLSIPKP